MKDFVHLHLHSEYSLLDGACRIPDIVRAAKEAGQTAVAITDHGAMYGVVDFYKAARKEGVRPVIGCEVYTAARTRHDRVFQLDSAHGHLILLCKNNVGYHNLIQLDSLAWTEGFYGKPRVDDELLARYHEGLIALSACLSGEIPRRLLAGDWAGAQEKAKRMREIFGPDFYLELQDHGLPQQKRVNPMLVRMARELHIPLVATNDVHFLRRQDYMLQKTLMCIQMNKMLDDPDSAGLDSEEFYFKTGDEMAALFPETPEAIENTVKIAEQCEVTFEFGKTVLPHFEVPDGQDHFEYFKAMCETGLARHYGDRPAPEVSARLSYELETIRKMGYVDYYLIVYDFIRYARSVGIAVGPGRGFGAGSLAAYCIGITGIDPIRYNLLFERFLNPERVSMPDFDIDFCYERRQEVIDYVVRKYGSDHVAQIVTFGTLAARAAIRDVGRVMNLSYGEVDTVAKLVPMEPNMTIDRALKESPDLRALCEGDERMRRLIDTARGLEGLPRHASTHAAGVVITRDPVSAYVPLAKNDEAVVTQFTMTTLEELGLLKMDFLGLRNLTVIQDSEKTIRRKYDSAFSIEKIPLGDKAVYDMLWSGKTEGVFQFESAGMRQVLMNLRPEGMEDLIAVISLYRPGPMESIPKYIENRHHPEKITYRHPLLESILRVTYGCIVYQEQVMEIVRKLAGYSYGRADLVRRAMAKKKTDVMQKERENFIHGLKRPDGSVECVGAVANGVSEQTANDIFDEMASFASYAFNKSHAAAYALLAYQTAFLKYHYPKEYMAALLTSVLDSADKVSEYISECGRLGIRILPPDVNESKTGFTVSGQNIRFGLLAVKNLGRGVADAIVAEQAAGPFHNFTDFVKRMQKADLNRRAVESLIKSGAFDGMGYTRRQLMLHFETVINRLEERQKHELTGQINLFEAPSGKAAEPEEQIPAEDEFEPAELLRQEKEMIGFYLTGHPLARYEAFRKKSGVPAVREITAEDSRFKDGSAASVLGIIQQKNIKSTRNGGTMAFVTVDDGSASIETIVFPKVLEEFHAKLAVDAVVLLRGRVSRREEEAPKLLCGSVQSAEEFDRADAAKGKSGRPGLYLRLQGRDTEEYGRTERLIAVFDGPTPLYFYFADTKKYLLAPRSQWVSVNKVLLGELKEILGPENVVVCS